MFKPCSFCRAKRVTCYIFVSLFFHSFFILLNFISILLRLFYLIYKLSAAEVTTGAEAAAVQENVSDTLAKRQRFSPLPPSIFIIA